MTPGLSLYPAQLTELRKSRPGQAPIGKKNHAQKIGHRKKKKEKVIDILLSSAQIKKKSEKKTRCCRRKSKDHSLPFNGFHSESETIKNSAYGEKYDLFPGNGLEGKFEGQQDQAQGNQKKPCNPDEMADDLIIKVSSPKDYRILPMLVPLSKISFGTTMKNAYTTHSTFYDP